MSVFKGACLIHASSVEAQVLVRAQDELYVACSPWLISQSRLQFTGGEGTIRSSLPDNLI